MEFGPFWDDASLAGEIVAQRTHTSSLFDSDLFCDEETLDAVVPEPTPTPAEAPTSAATPPSDAWRTFMDDNCPFRRRVKVTVAPSRKRAACTALSPPPAARKRSRVDSQRVLHFPPQFAVAPGVPRRVRVLAPPAPEAPDQLEALLESADDFLPSLPSDCELALQVDLAGVSATDTPHNDDDGYITSKLHSRLRAALAPSAPDIDTITALSRVSTSRSSTSYSSCALPRIDDALLAVTRAAAAYSAQLSIAPA